MKKKKKKEKKKKKSKSVKFEVASFIYLQSIKPATVVKQKQTPRGVL